MVPEKAYQAFFKFAKEQKEIYRQVGNVLLDRDIPIIPRLPSDKGKARALLENHIRAAESENWTHPQVAVRKLDLKGMGFEPTRAAIPLPGEKWFTPSYRSGKMHAHKMGPFYLVHEDESAPKGFADTVSHLIKDTPKPLLKRIFEKIPPPVVNR